MRTKEFRIENFIKNNVDGIVATYGVSKWGDILTTTEEVDLLEYFTSLFNTLDVKGTIISYSIDLGYKPLCWEDDDYVYRIMVSVENETVLQSFTKAITDYFDGTMVKLDEFKRPKNFAKYIKKFAKYSMKDCFVVTNEIETLAIDCNCNYYGLRFDVEAEETVRLRKLSGLTTSPSILLALKNNASTKYLKYNLFDDENNATA